MIGEAVIPSAPPSVAAMLGWFPQPVPLLPVLVVGLAVWYLVAVRVIRAHGRKWEWGANCEDLRRHKNTDGAPLDQGDVGWREFGGSGDVCQRVSFASMLGDPADTEGPGWVALRS